MNPLLAIAFYVTGLEAPPPPPPPPPPIVHEACDWSMINNEEGGCLSDAPTVGEGEHGTVPEVIDFATGWVTYPDGGVYCVNGAPCQDEAGDDSSLYTYDWNTKEYR